MFIRGCCSDNGSKIAGHRSKPCRISGCFANRMFPPFAHWCFVHGDEVCDVTQSAAPHQIYDANRPMLLSLIAAWGFVAVDLGHVNDDRDQLRERLDHAQENVDVLLTSGGASAGDEDHLSALLSETGSIEFWRIAVKPGRPLAMGMWGAMPIFGLPGNPVAAATCAMILRALPLMCWQGALDDAAILLGEGQFRKTEKTRAA